MGNFSERDKRALKWLLIFVGLVLAYNYVVSPYFDSSDNKATDLDFAIMTLKRQRQLIRGESKLQEGFQQLEARIAEEEKRLLPGEKPSLAAAELQKIVNSIIRRQDGIILSGKPLLPKEVDTYLVIPVQVSLNCRVSSLKNILYQLEAYPLLLRIPEVKIKVLKKRSPKDVQVVLVIEGLIRKGEDYA